MLDSMTGSATFVRNGRMDVLAINPLGRALLAPMFDSDTTDERGQVNIARFQFLDPTAQDYYPDWESAANITVALLRSEAGRHPYDKALRGLVGELSTVSADFRTRWAAHNVRIHHSGVKRFLHPDVGPVEITYHSMGVSASEHDAYDITIYTAEPGSASEDRLRLLASWAATDPTFNHNPVEEVK